MGARRGIAGESPGNRWGIVGEWAHAVRPYRRINERMETQSSKSSLPNREMKGLTTQWHAC
ncbi:MAG: hypothetical protein RIB93_00395 [Coleofasciculus sp. D1-CHI-01]|uniref:hypothetical protein n=1 Tax=Coleofasciculus sp. D1-CHI-01 TaxID=3068482 RepID=UPI003302B0E7